MRARKSITIPYFQKSSPLDLRDDFLYFFNNPTGVFIKWSRRIQRGQEGLNFCFQVRILSIYYSLNLKIYRETVCNLVYFYSNLLSQFLFLFSILHWSVYINIFLGAVHWFWNIHYVHSFTIIWKSQVHFFIAGN